MLLWDGSLSRIQQESIYAPFSDLPTDVNDQMLLGSTRSHLLRNDFFLERARDWHLGCGGLTVG